LIRDNALAVSGLLNEEIGGKSVLPYHPKGLWEEMAFGEASRCKSTCKGTARICIAAQCTRSGNARCRRPRFRPLTRRIGRNAVARRPVTNTPLQALITLNDPTYVEAARKLAERALHEGGKDVNSRLIFAFRLATARKPSMQETKVLRDLLTQQLANYRANPQAADKLLKVGESAVDEKLDRVELASWTLVASTILNLDEAITKEIGLASIEIGKMAMTFTDVMKELEACGSPQFARPGRATASAARCSASVTPTSIECKKPSSSISRWLSSFGRRTITTRRCWRR
jgi:hypothetical protein